MTRAFLSTVSFRPRPKSANDLWTGKGGSKHSDFLTSPVRHCSRTIVCPPASSTQASAQHHLARGRPGSLPKAPLPAFTTLPSSPFSPQISSRTLSLPRFCLLWEGKKSLLLLPRHCHFLPTAALAPGSLLPSPRPPSAGKSSPGASETAESSRVL